MIPENRAGGLGAEQGATAPPLQPPESRDTGSLFEPLAGGGGAHACIRVSARYTVLKRQESGNSEPEGTLRKTINTKPRTSLLQEDSGACL